MDPECVHTAPTANEIAQPIRTLLVTTIMAPYRIPVFNALASHRDVRLRVLYLAETGPHRAWPLYRDEMHYDYRVLRELVRLQWHGNWMHVSLGLLGELRAWQPDVVIAGGWDQLPNLVAFALRRSFGYGFICWAESTARDARVASRVAEAIKRRVVGDSDAVLVSGSAARRYVTMLGAATDSVFTAPNAVDNGFFNKHGCADRVSREGRCRFLYVGRLHPAKGIHVLLQAWQELPDDVGTLVLVGDGPLRAEIEQLVQTKKLQRVKLRGHVDRKALAEEYAQADLFVFPSLTDPWGLVINEAMAAGLPVITTSAPGAVDDLVEDRVNGLVVAPGDTGALTLALRELGANRGMRLAMGEASLRRIGSFSPERCALGFVDAVRACATLRQERRR